MCGIIGYIGAKEVCPILLHGLQKLEYRGYDSVGLGVVGTNGMQMVKKKGKVSDLASALLSELPQGTKFGIAHTRWATHGEPSETNAHPHFDCKKELCVVHNGIIENYRVLREKLIAEGHKIVSETDSEIVAHLIEKYYTGDIESAVMQALREVEGAFGLAVIHRKEQKIIAARRGSPLVLGIGDGGMFVASDVSAMIEHTRKVLYLSDDQVATVTAEQYLIKNLNGNPIETPVVQEIQWAIDTVEKQGQKHFMLKEILEQPGILENIIRGRIQKGKIVLDLPKNLKEYSKIVLVACGTSWHAALAGKYLLEQLAEIPVEVDYASEFRYRNPIIDATTLVIAISQSGETADTLAALREAKKKGASTMGIINVVGSSIAREVEAMLYINAGPEISVASTKAFTSQLMALTLFGLWLRQEKRMSVEQELMQSLVALPDQMRAIIGKNEAIKEIAESLRECKDFLYLGRGINFPVALEGALKLKEISYIHAEGYPAAEMKHGPIALIDEHVPVVFIAPQSATYEKIASNVQEIKARKGKVIAIINEGDTDIKHSAEFTFEVPVTHELLSPILATIPLQLLAYYIADAKGIDVDKPRNLAKSVTVE